MKKALTILSAAVLLLATGCNKNPFSLKGSEISFGSSAEKMATRTEYGATNTAGTKQAIDWVVGDIVRIISPEAAVTGNGSNLHWADYTVSSVTKNEDATSAALVNTNPNGLAWTDAETYSFYSVYPASAGISLEDATYAQVSANFLQAEPALPTSTTTKTVGEGESAITYTVYTPDIKNAVLTAAVSGVKESNEKPQVQLHFKPTWTAIEFNLSCKDAEPVEITQIQLVAEEPDLLVAPFTMTAGADLSTITVGTTGTSNTVTLNTTTGSDGITLTETQGATFTMLLLPKKNTKTLKFRVTSKEGDSTKTSVVSLTKNGNTFELEPGKLYRINGFKVPGNYWRIFYAPDILDVDAWEELGETSLIVE